MNTHDHERIADAFNRLRPDWPVKQLRTLLADDRIADRPRRDVVVALGWVACEAGTASPYRVLEAGPWWRAAAVEGGNPNRREPYDARRTCHTCGLVEDHCRSRWAADHEFESVAGAKTRAARDETDVPRVVAALKAEMASAER